MSDTKRKAKRLPSFLSTAHLHHRSKLPLLLCLIFCCGSIACGPKTLTGSWIANDNGMYYVRQIGNDVWWVGFSSESQYGVGDIHRGLVFTNVFHGTVSGNTITGNFVDLPKGQMSSYGPLTLTWNQVNELESVAAPGAYRATSWKRFGYYLPPPDVFAIFQDVMKNQKAWDDHSLLDNLKPAKSDFVSILGRITNQPTSSNPPYGTDPYVIKMAYPPDTTAAPPNAGRTYHDFICLDQNDSPPDGDLTFDIHIDWDNLNQQIGFWSNGWETSHGVTADNFGDKLNVAYRIHGEVIMYGGTTECGDSGPTEFLAPGWGWEQQGALATLFNGVPIAGNVAFSGPPDPSDHLSVQATSILGVPIGWNSYVRVNGILALDCGHGVWYDKTPCNETKPQYQNQEIHPVYSIDLIQDFSQPRPYADLTGVWAANDAGTYYLRQVGNNVDNNSVGQVGNTVWWLGLSTDEGLTFANVFQGTLQNNQISGNWVDIQIGQLAPTANAGVISLNGNNGALSFMMNRLNETGGFAAANWQKLYDAGGRQIVISLDQVEFGSPTWPETGEGIEIQVGPTRMKVKPQNPRTVKLVDGRRVTQADIPAKIPVDAPDLGGLRMSAQFAGYRANWTLSEADFKGGRHVQSMIPPHVLHLRASAENEAQPSEATNTASGLRETQQTTRKAATSSVPTLNIHYRIEPADPSGHNRLPK
jgi:hypothetical protein